MSEMRKEHEIAECINTPTLETERLIENDIEALFLILKDEEVNRFLPWFPLKNMEEARKFYEERYAAEYAQSQAYAYAICLKDDNFPVGYVKVDMEELTISVMGFAKNIGTEALFRRLPRLL